MRILHVVILVGLGIVAARAEDWEVNDKTYHNVTVDQVDGQTVHITYDDGITTLALADLPPDVQKRLTPPPDTDAQKVAAFEAQVKASQVFIVRVGNTDLKFCNPSGMVEMKKDDPMAHVADDQVPANCVGLRHCISADAYDPVKSEEAATDPTTREDIMTSDTYIFKDVQMDVESDRFIDLVQDLAVKVTLGIYWKKDSIIDDEDVQKRLDLFQKDTGVKLDPTSNLYTLGLVSQSVGCVSFLTAQYLNETYQAKTTRVKVVSMVTYMLLNHKLIIAVTSLSKGLIVQRDTLELQKVGENYQLALQVLNN